MSKRKISAVQVGGFRPTLDPFSTNFGMTALASEGETWPEAADKPMLFVCQLNLTQATVIPPLLEDIQLITFFVEPEIAALSEENGSNWMLRAYKSLTGLKPLAQPAGTPRLRKGFECRWEELTDAKAERTKIGGTPSEIQSEPWWKYRAHPANPKYCLQVNSEEKVGLMWGDAGTVFLARGTTQGYQDNWFLDIQFF